jgi:hypothetical protein
VIDVAALDAGARLVCLAPDGTILRVEEAGRRYGKELGLDLAVGSALTLEQGRALAELMADKLFAAMADFKPGDRVTIKVDPRRPEESLFLGAA